MSLTLVIGNKNYSSWSLRPWIAMKVAGIAFEEKLIPLYLEGSREQILKFSSAGKVPVLIDGATCVWESLAILEYLADKFPEKHLWPAETSVRGLARAAACEMHAGFPALRQHCTMNLWLPPKPRPQPAEVRAEVERIEALWADCRSRFGQKAESSGPFLFGSFGAADAMYAPVVARFHNYGIAVGQATRTYMDAVMNLPAWKEWTGAAMKEPWVMRQNEPEWPLVRGVAVSQ